jgi:hypothetical protein
MTYSGPAPKPTTFIFKPKPDGKPIQPISPERKAEAIARAKELEKK